MAKTIDAAKREAGKSSAKKHNTNSIITAEIGKVYLSLQKCNGKCLIELSTDCVDPDLNHLQDFVEDNHGVQLEPEQMISGCLGYVSHEVEPKVLDAVRRWIINNTNWRLMREVKG